MYGEKHSEGQPLQDQEEILHDVEECSYFLNLLSIIVRHSRANVWPSFSSPIYVRDPPDLVKNLPNEKDPVPSIQLFLTKACIGILQVRQTEQEDIKAKIAKLRQGSVLLLQQLIVGSTPNLDLEIGLDKILIDTLSWSISQKELLLQVPLMDLIFVFLQAQTQPIVSSPIPHRRQMSRETFRSASQVSLPHDKNSKDDASVQIATPLPELLDCLIVGISSPNTHLLLEQWVSFMNKCLTLYVSSPFQGLMPLVDCFIKTVEFTFKQLQELFEAAMPPINGQSDHILMINILLNGLEHVLARGHDQLVHDEGRAASVKSPEQVQGFFGNMVSGVFASEVQKSRATTANNRLTVLLCFKDAVRVSFDMWSWADVGLGIASPETASSASFNYTSLRLRNRTRRILEHLFTAEALECLETLVEIWRQAGSSSGAIGSNTVFNLLHALEGSRPKNTIPALFNAIYSRTNPSVLDPMRKSTLTSELSDTSLATFLVSYTRSMEDDALDEIWSDCMTFLRDVLGNPLPHRQTLPILLQFTAVLGEKIDNTNFGEQRKMRRDIGVREKQPDQLFRTDKTLGPIRPSSRCNFYNKASIILTGFKFIN